MITKGIVERVISPYLCKVRIPIYDKARSSPNATPTDDLGEATFCSIPNINVAIQAGDIVYVAFENNDIHNLVILGYLHKEGDTSTLLDIKGNTIEIENSANLPINTKIGNVTAEEISYLSGLDGNIQAQLNLLDTTYKSITDHLQDEIDNIVISGGDKSWIHTQASEASIWTITHNLSKYPSVTVIDSNNEQCFGKITYNNNNTVTLTFSTAIAGIAYLN